MNNILLAIFFLILGLLFANMLTNVCGCKDLVEGQCDESEGCVWNTEYCPQLPRGQIRGGGRYRTLDQLNSYCAAAGASTAPVYLVGGGNLPDVGDNHQYTPDLFEQVNWKDTTCCTNSSETTITPGGGGGGSGGARANPTSGRYKLSCNGGEMMFTSL